MIKFYNFTYSEI